MFNLCNLCQVTQQKVPVRLPWRLSSMQISFGALCICTHSCSDRFDCFWFFLNSSRLAALIPSVGAKIKGKVERLSVYLVSIHILFKYEKKSKVWKDGAEPKSGERLESRTQHPVPKDKAKLNVTAALTAFEVRANSADLYFLLT